MRLFGLIGHPLEHSFSPGYFREKFQREGIEAQYRLFALNSVREFPDLINEYPNLEGLNVTIPYKKQIIPYLDRLEGEAKEIGAVNTLVFHKRQGKMRSVSGYNTDVFGFIQSIRPLLKPHHRHALVLGTGGSAAMVGYALRKLGVDPLFVTRSNHLSEGAVSYTQLTPEEMNHRSVIVNTTPVGMYPRVGQKPAIPYSAIGPNHLLFDLVYNPTETLFLQEGRKRGAGVKNGYQMLCLQAEKSWQIWNATD
jgi:shikimate dehydrogenase